MPGFNYEEENLTHRDHLDPDKHWIGEALPSPSIGEVAVSGFTSGVGESPFPARADHYHDNRYRYGRFNTPTGKVCPGSSAGAKTYIDGLNYLAGYDMLSGSQLLIPNRDGLYLITANIVIQKATFPATTAFIVNIEYNGGAAVRIVEQGNLPQGRTNFYMTISDQVVLGVGGDIQLSYTNFENAVNHAFYVISLVVTRLCSSVNA